jgi:ferrochelatase
MPDTPKSGVLLVNLGSPDSPSVPDVRRYLREFLMDGRVLDAPWPIRFCIVHLAILPTRPKRSAEAYQKVWTSEGSPLTVVSKRVCSLLAQRFDFPIELAMRYQNPSIPVALSRLRDAGVQDLLVFPLFPHYAMSSYESAVERVKEIAANLAPQMRLSVQPPFYNDSDYLQALVANAQPYINSGFDHLLFSFHGIPERHLRKSDPTGHHCLQNANCCQTPSPAHERCYRAQCLQTARAFVERAAIPADKYSVAFQSRLGREPWLSPYTDHELIRLGREGVKKLLVICPSFVSDCLETIEEIGMRGRDSFLGEGGKELIRIPCLNDHPLWLDAMQTMIQQWRSTHRPNDNRDQKAR